MKERLFTIGLLLALQATVASAQTPESFFPSQVGNLWEYQIISNGELYQIAFTGDSLLPGGSRYIFYSATILYRIDTSANVYLYPLDTTAFNWLLYKLAADSGEAWRIRPLPNYRYWAWVARVESSTVFSRPTVIKTYRYSPGHPDSGGANYYLEERKLASGFGLIYEWHEPWDIRYLRGCIIGSDTFGIITSVVNQIGEEIPTSFYLRPNYPNPFNAETNIEFELPIAEYVSLKIFDVLGREIETLYERRLPAGTYLVRWNAAQVPSGVYFVRMSTPHGIQTKKMILIR